MEEKLRKTPLVVKNSLAEAKVIEELATSRGLSESNLIRRLVKAAAETEGIDVTGLFEDGKPGNWLPKPKGKGNRQAHKRLAVITETTEIITISAV